MRFTSLVLMIFTISSCGSGEKKQAIQNEESLKQEYLQKGEQIASQTQTELLKNVSFAMSKGGPEHAIGFCNVRALPIKDSLSRLHNCQISRISSKYRNPADKPQSEMEKDQLKLYELAFQKGGSINPEVYFFDDRVEYYQAITIAMEACLKCHGDPATQITEGTLSKINTLYPNDLATGYALNDFRGAWKITFTLD